MTTKRERKALAKKVRAAADYIDRVGLYKGNFFDHDQAAKRGVDTGFGWREQVAVAGVKCCTLGALQAHGAHALPDLEVYLAETHPRVERHGIVDGRPAASVPHWNDKPSRRKKDVVALLRGFADKLDAQS